MYLRQENIINYFDDVMKRELIKFCERINESDADIFILMARKAACFFQVLVESGYIDSTVVMKKKIVTDRSVDFSNSYLKGKKILIVDDVIFSGSTIAKMVLYLKSCGVEVQNISILVLAVNSDTFKMKFISDDVGHDIFRINDSAKLGNADCTKLCGDISRILSILGKPYDVDFPAYHDLYLSCDQILPWVVLPQYWDLYNVSNEYHNQVGIEAYTLIPTKLVTNFIWKFLNINLDHVAEYKIRIYSFGIGMEKRFKVLPMLIFNEISYCTLDKIFAKVCNKLKDLDIKIEEYFISQSAKMRFLQYYIANLLYITFFCLCDLPIQNMRKYSIPYLFGYDCLGLLQNAIAVSSAEYQNSFELISSFRDPLVEVHSEDYCNKLDYIVPEDNSINTFDVNLRLLDPFIYWYKKSEKPARDKLANTRLDLNNHNFFQDIKRLEVGFSFNCLKEFVKEIKEYYNIDKLVSTFVDRAVDLGLLVPIIFNDDSRKIICRAFRHGEDLPFGDGDQIVLLYFLESFFGGIEGKNLSHLQFQKIVALFIQLGIRENLFNVFLGFDNSQLLTVKYCIHGAVPVIVKQNAEIAELHPYVKKNEYSEWLSERLVHKGIIKRDKSGIELKQKNLEPSKDLSNRVIIRTKIIAKMLSEWFNISCNINKKTVFTDNMIVLTSCLNAEAFSSAILAELFICRTDWAYNLKQMLGNYSRNTKNRCKKYFIESMRSSNVFTAMNSGRKKYLWFKKNEEGRNSVQTVIDEVSGLFESQGEEMISLNWNELWNDYLTISQSQDFIDSNIMECVGHIYCYNICYRIIEYLILQSMRETENQRKSIEEEIVELKSEYEGLALKQPRINYLLQIPNSKLDNGLKKMYDYMLLLDHQVEVDMLSIEQYISKSSNQYVIRYHSCVVFDFDLTKCDECLKIVTNELTEKGKKQLAFVLHEKEFTRVCVVFNAENPKAVILELIQRVYSRCSGIKVRCIAIPVLPHNKEFKLNCKINAQAGAVDFKEKIISPLENLYTYNKPNDNEILFVAKSNDSNNEPDYKDKAIMEKSGVSFGKTETGNVKFPFCNEEYNYMKYSDPEIIVGIIAILPEEFNAIKKRYSMKKNPPNENSKRIFYESVVALEHKKYRLILTQAQGQGNQAGASAYYGLNKSFRLDYVVLLGIAGSVNKDKAKIGDVVIARAVFDGQIGKETANKFKPEIKMYAPNAIVNSIIIDFMNEATGYAYPNLQKEPDSTFLCCYEPIGNNGHLIADRGSEFIDNLQSNVDRKIVAVEMESAGVAYGVYQAALEGLCEKLVIIRGISDYADPDKSPKNQYHVPASENAATIFDELLKYFY